MCNLCLFLGQRTTKTRRANRLEFGWTDFGRNDLKPYTLPWVVVRIWQITIDGYSIAETERFKFYKQWLVVGRKVRVWPANDLVVFDVLLTHWAQHSDGNQKIGGEINIIYDSCEWICEVAILHLLLGIRSLEFEAMRQVAALLAVFTVAKAGEKSFVLHVKEVTMITSYSTIVQEFYCSWVRQWIEIATKHQRNGLAWRRAIFTLNWKLKQSLFGFVYRTIFPVTGVSIKIEVSSRFE